jgi:hypothetical protein
MRTEQRLEGAGEFPCPDTGLAGPKSGGTCQKPQREATPLSGMRQKCPRRGQGLSEMGVTATLQGNLATRIIEKRDACAGYDAANRSDFCCGSLCGLTNSTRA